MDHPAQKRGSAGGGYPPEKRLRREPEDTGVYSDRIRERLQNSSRTGQACDRCKERKMKCDSGQDGCHSCQKANLPCRATDRITGQAQVRGETERLRRENEELKSQVQAFRQHFDLQSSAQLSASTFQPAGASPGGYQGRRRSKQQNTVMDYRTNPTVDKASHVHSHSPQRGPIHETTIDLMDGEIDIAAFECPDIDRTMEISQNLFPIGVSAVSEIQKPEKPQMPSREEALQCVDNFLKVIATYIPIVHGPSFRRLVTQFYDDQDAFDNKAAETVMITIVLAVLFFQMATRNPSMRQEKLAQSNRLYQYALCFFSQLLLETSLESMQALALFLVHARNLPKPGNSWTASSMVLARAIELDYHRSSKKIALPPEQNNFLAIELRKRVFWSVLGVQTTIAVKMGRPVQISPQDMDVELPTAMLDCEISAQGGLTASGKCDFWGHIFLSKKLPLLMDLYQNVILVRKSERDYLNDVAELDSQICKWRHEWDQATEREAQTGSHKTATHMIDIWYAEFRLILHHPRLCTSEAGEVHDKNLEISMQAARIIRQNALSLIQDFKGADFTWHFVSIYVLAMSIALHHHYDNMKKERVNSEVVTRIRYDLSEWLIIMKAADRYMCSEDRLIKFFLPLVQRCLEDAQNVATASAAVQNGYRRGSRGQGKAMGGETTAHQVAAAVLAAESYPQHAGQPNYLSANMMSANVASPLQQHQQHHHQHPHVYTAQPDATAFSSSSTSSSPPVTTDTGVLGTTTTNGQQPTHKAPLQYNIGYPLPANTQPSPMPSPAPAPSASITNPAVATTATPIAIAPSQPRPPPPAHPHNGPPCLTHWPPPLRDCPLPPGLAYSPARPNNLETIDMYSTFSNGVWPLNIVQYPHGEV